MAIEVVKQGDREVVVKVDVAPRDFSTGSIGYGAYGAVVVDGLRHQTTVNVVVQGSKKWDDDAKLAWLSAHVVTHVEMVAVADLFKSTNTGWRINSTLTVGGETCTVGGGVVLSNKTVAAAGAKAAKLAARAEREKEAIAAHKAARKSAIDAMKASVAKAEKA